MNRIFASIFLLTISCGSNHINRSSSDTQDLIGVGPKGEVYAAKHYRKYTKRLPNGVITTFENIFAFKRCPDHTNFIAECEFEPASEAYPARGNHPIIVGYSVMRSLQHRILESSIDAGITVAEKALAKRYEELEDETTDLGKKWLKVADAIDEKEKIEAFITQHGEENADMERLAQINAYLATDEAVTTATLAENIQAARDKLVEIGYNMLDRLENSDLIWRHNGNHVIPQDGSNPITAGQLNIMYEFVKETAK